ncbi:MAG: hypothetical protein RIQ78_633 [Bacteroidota bacterium]|jgi:hypothetical protein
MITDYLTTKSPLNVAFHRHFTGFTGGHLKVFDYFNHVCSSPGGTLTQFYNLAEIKSLESLLLES